MKLLWTTLCLSALSAVSSRPLSSPPASSSSPPTSASSRVCGSDLVRLVTAACAASPGSDSGLRAHEALCCRTRCSEDSIAKDCDAWLSLLRVPLGSPPGAETRSMSIEAAVALQGRVGQVRQKPEPSAENENRSIAENRSSTERPTSMERPSSYSFHFGSASFPGNEVFPVGRARSRALRRRRRNAMEFQLSWGFPREPNSLIPVNDTTGDVIDRTKTRSNNNALRSLMTGNSRRR